MTNIDLGIVVAYLLFTLWVGIRYAKGTKNMELFATGGRNFSTGALAATITATYISGSSFVIGITQGYQDGLLVFFALAGQVIAIMIVASIFVPRMGEFLGNFSVAESMRSLFGVNVGIITAVAGFMLCAGMVAMQIKILATTFSYLGGVSVNLAVVACAFVMIVYSMSGGIRGVIVTDILQFITFMVVVPAIGIGLWYQIYDNPDIDAASEVYHHAFAFKSVSGTDYLTLFIFSLIPSLSPSSFQRIVISKTTMQAKKALGYSSYMYLVYLLIASLIGILLFVYNPDLEKKAIVSYMIDQFTATGLKGLTFVAIIAMAMSTADSNLNAFAVMFTHDFCKQLGITKSVQSELSLAKIATVGVGIVALFLSLYFDNLIELLLFTRNFYMPVVFPALSLAILGFRSNTKSVLKGMAAGFATVVVWKSVHKFYPLPIDSLLPATFTNFFVYFLAHYISGAPGGWVGPKDTGPLELAKLEKARSN
jgi:Na+/proline symporter